MSGVQILRALLVADTDLIARIPAAKIIAGVIPQRTTMPALAITNIYSADVNILKEGVTHKVNARTQATLICSTYREVEDIIKLVRKAGRSKIGVAGFVDATCHTDAEGPDFNDYNSGVYMRTQDFRITFTEIS